MDLLLYLPRKVEGPVPVFLILNFEGNHTISMDPLVERPEWPAGSDPGRVRSLKSERGDQVGRFSLAAILGGTSRLSHRKRTRRRWADGGLTKHETVEE